MNCARGFAADLDAELVTGVIDRFVFDVCRGAEKKGASNDPPFIFIVAVKSLAQTCRVVRNSLNV